METKRTVTRREFLRLVGITVAGAALASCTAPTPTAVQEATEAPVKEPVEAPTEKPVEKPTEKPVEKPTDAPVVEEPVDTAPAFKDPPMLAPMVAAGELPPIEQRLPVNPLVFPMMEMTGKHGGVIRRAFNGVSDRWGPTKLRDRGLVWFDKDLVNRPRLAESWSVNEDGSAWTFKMRKGLKWSDGVDYTTADVKWWYDHYVINTDLQPTVGGNYSTGTPKVAMTLETPDDYTFTVKFAHPNPLFLLKIGREQFAEPAHHMKQWHIDTCDDKDALNKAAADAGFDSWTTYYENDRRWWYLNKDYPNFGAWLIGEGSLAEERFTMMRNPYFFGVDPDGYQLPYFDQINHRLFESPEVLNLRIVNGEIDFQARHVQPGNYTLYKESEAQGDYKVVVGVSAGHVAVQLNLATKEPKLNKFFNTRDVRIGLSLAIDREQINELVFYGLAIPRQYSPIRSSPQYYPKLTNAYIEYNVDEANARLDAAGYDKKDAEGFRTYPEDGTTISFTIEGTDQPGSSNEDAVQQIVKMWEAVGVKCAYKYAERSLYTEHYQANEIEAAFWGGDRTVLPLSPSAIIFRGTQPDRPWAAGFGNWYNDPTSPGGVEPPADHFIRKIWEIWDQVSVEVDPAKQNELFFKILDIWAEELPMISALGELPSLCIVKNGIHNFVEGFPNDDTTGDENIYNTETYFWDEPDNHTG
jgi:peptide/nickel transport system substrate-binding protein